MRAAPSAAAAIDVGAARGSGVRAAGCAFGAAATLLVVLLLGRVLGAQVPGLCPGSPVPARAPGCQHTARPGWRVAAGQMAPGG